MKELMNDLRFELLEVDGLGEALKKLFLSKALIGVEWKPGIKDPVTHTDYKNWKP